MKSINQTLKELVCTALAAPENSPQRQQSLHRIYAIAMSSGKLWRESTPYYGDAVNEMWQECFTQLEQYDPDEKEVLTWLNDSLRRALQRFEYRQKRDLKKHVSHVMDEEGQSIAVVEILPGSPDAEDAFQATLDPILNWVQTDPDGKLQNRIFRKRPEINAQAVILRRLPLNSQSWSDIAADFHLNASEAEDLPKWYSRHCKLLLRDFGYQSGLLPNTQDD
jgi:hypothetical protein